MPICYDISITIDRQPQEGASYETHLLRSIELPSAVSPQELDAVVQQEWQRFAENIGRYDASRISQYSFTGNYRVISIIRC